MSHYRNPSPPPGYVHGPPIELVKLKSDYTIVDGVPLICYDLLVESGIFDDDISGSDEFTVLTSDEEEEAAAPIVNIKQEPPSSPEVSPEVETVLSSELTKIKIENDDSRKEIKKEKSKKKKRERSNSSSSDDSFHSSRHSKAPTDIKRKQKSKSIDEKPDHEKRKTVHRRKSSSSEDLSEREERKIKIETPIKKEIKQENFDIDRKPEFENMLYGSYYCDVCKLTMNSLGTYQSHMIGKRHKKAVRLKNTAEVVAKTIAPTKVENRYPPPPPGVRRMRTGDIAIIQKIVDELKGPLPGLEKVIEIQGLMENTYYCELCDAPCAPITIIPHLQGHKHQLHTLKCFEPEMYESFQNKKKYEVEKKIPKILMRIEDNFGRGIITVEKEYEAKNAPHGSKESSFTRRRDMPGPSYRDPEDVYPANYAMTTIPDTSKSDFYCRICDSHMNSEQMWEAHIRGKRHLTNTKKAPGVAPSKTKSVLLPGAHPKLLRELDAIRDEPVVGLEQMRETQNPDAPGEMYNCFLCGASLTTIDVIDHILSLKHKIKFLEKIRHPEMMLLQGITIQENKMACVVDEICAKFEDKHGRGRMEVHVMRNAGATW